MTSYLHVSSFDAYGAGIAATRLHLALRSIGHDSRLLVCDQFSSLEGVSTLIPGSASFRRRRTLPGFVQGLLFEERYCVYSAYTKRDSNVVDAICREVEHVDVLVLHWVAYFLSVRDIAEIARRTRVPIIWYALDMAPFTGGCHYAWGCERYSNGCNECPAVRFVFGKAAVRDNMATKLKLFSDRRVQLVAPNQFVSRQAQKAVAQTAEVPVAYIPIPDEVFAPKREPSSGNTIRILFGYADYGTPRKGGVEFVQSIRLLHAALRESGASVDLRVVLPTDSRDSALGSDLPIEVEIVSRARSDHDLAALYDNVDCFVNASLEDSGPMMISEALLTGCPVISFQVGIADELIRNGENGFLAKLGDARALAERILQFVKLEPAERRQMARRARASVIDVVSAAGAARSFDAVATTIKAVDSREVSH